MREKAFSTPDSSQIAITIGTPISRAFFSPAAISAWAVSAEIDALVSTLAGIAMLHSFRGSPRL